MRNDFDDIIRNNLWALLMVCAIFGHCLYASSGGPYELSWYTIDGGGAEISGGVYTLTGTIGQPDAGYHTGTPYDLSGGFWVGGQLCFVNLEDFAQFAEYWLEVSCDGGNDYCNGADINGDNSVDIDDLELFANEWLDICPPGWPWR